MPAKRFRSKKLWWLAVREKILFLSFLALFTLINPKQEGQGVVAAFPGLPTSRHETLAIPTPAPYPVNTTGTQPPESITAYSSLVVDADSAVSMYTKNEGEPLPPASTTKIMTALVALDQYPPSEIVTIGAATVSGQLMDLRVGERITVENLLYGLLIQSGNDAANALAAHHPQGYQAFMTAMNEKAKALSLTETYFIDPIGLDDPNQKMSARDLARLSRYALEKPLIAKIVAIPQITVSDADFTIFHNLRNVNQLLGKIPGVAGIKTGWTENAGENLVTLVERGGHRVIIVTMKSKDRFGDTAKLIDWAFANHQWVKYGM